jgi:hypothetical protein
MIRLTRRSSSTPTAILRLTRELLLRSSNNKRLIQQLRRIRKFRRQMWRKTKSVLPPAWAMLGQSRKKTVHIIISMSMKVTVLIETCVLWAK